jgi:hypothetical protein
VLGAFVIGMAVGFASGVMFAAQQGPPQPPASL